MRILTPDIPQSGEFIVTNWQEITTPEPHAEVVMGHFRDVQSGDRDRYLYRPRHRARMRPWKVSTIAGSICGAYLVTCWAAFR